jgi:hypothetical protein
MENASMLDHGDKWTPIPDWRHATIEVAGLRVGTIEVGGQFLVSGDLDGFRNRHGLGRAVGALVAAIGHRYCVQLASDRMLAVGLDATEVELGWGGSGHAVTRVGSALHVFEISGPDAMSLVNRACVLDQAHASRSAAVLFAGIAAQLYRHDGGALRLHVDRGLAAYVWNWIGSRTSFLQPSHAS